jgi:hypothetical protein
VPFKRDPNFGVAMTFLKYRRAYLLHLKEGK